MRNDSGQTLEERVAAIEDRFAIYNLLAAQPPSADTGSEAFLRSIYTEDSSLDRGGQAQSISGLDDIVAYVHSEAHQQAIANGLAHIGTLPLVELDGNSATATSYILIISLDREGQSRELPNHGTSTGYRIHRVVVNRWDLVRAASGAWRIRKRQMSRVDGESEYLDMLLKSRSGISNDGSKV